VSVFRVNATDLPRLRHEMWLHASADHPAIRDYLQGTVDQVRQYGNLNYATGVRPADLVRWMQVADLYLVTEDMTAIAAQAAEAMPGYRVDREFVPSRIGLLVWQATVSVPAMAPTGGTIEIFPMRAVLWGPTMTKQGPGVVLIPMTPVDEAVAIPSIRASIEETTAREAKKGRVLHEIRSVSGPLVMGDAYVLAYGEAPHQSENMAIKATVATWLMMHQRITVTSSEYMPRHLRKWAAREKLAPPQVTSIALRRVDYVGSHRDGSPESPGREYSCRWYVTGHWRYLDREKYPDKTPTWVSECVRGPADKPVKGGERIAVWRR
jgi:hypothetical protein